MPGGEVKEGSGFLFGFQLLGYGAAPIEVDELAVLRTKCVVWAFQAFAAAFFPAEDDSLVWAFPGFLPGEVLPDGLLDGSFDAVWHLAYLQAQGLPEDSFLDDADAVFSGAFGFAGLGVRVGDHEDVEFLGDAFGYLQAAFGSELQGETAGDGLAVPGAFVGAGEADALSGQAIPREGDDGRRWGRLLGAAAAGGGDGCVEVVGR